MPLKTSKPAPLMPTAKPLLICKLKNTETERYKGKVLFQKIHWRAEESFIMDWSYMRKREKHG